VIIEANVEFNEFDVEGFLNVEGHPELSYTEPRFSYGYAGFKISRRRVAGQGIYAAGAALEVNAVSKSWLLRSFVLPSSKLACEGTNIAQVSDPEVDKDGIACNRIERCEIAVEAGERIRILFSGLIGAPSFGGGVAAIDGLTLWAEIEFDRRAVFPFQPTG